MNRSYLGFLERDKARLDVAWIARISSSTAALGIPRLGISSSARRPLNSSVPLELDSGFGKGEEGNGAMDFEFGGKVEWLWKDGAN